MHGNKCVHSDCLYRAKIGTIKICDYLEFTGHMRGCPSDERCTRYVHATPRERDKARKKRYRNQRGRNYQQNWKDIHVDIGHATKEDDNHGSAIKRDY